MYRLTVGNQTIPFSEETRLSDLLRSKGLSLPCGGNGTCGKCKVFASGALSELTAVEQKLLTKAEIEAGIRLACMTFARGDVTVSIPKEDSTRVELSGASDSDFLQDGVSVDIGTTTIAMYLYQNGKVVNAVGEQNRQGVFGADVITRIGQNQPDVLHETVVNQLNEMLDALIAGKTTHAAIKRIVITGNTTMLHFAAGLDPAGIAVFPFTPQSLFGETRSVDGLFAKCEKAEIYFPPCAASYVGADLLSAVIASKMHLKDEVALLADIGTNGEMALKANGKIVSCSTAAGPALEGASIYMGMPAKKGAINAVSYNGQSFSYTTIDDGKPVGICGAGLISLIAALLEAGLIDETGFLSADNCQNPSICDLIEEDDETVFHIPGTAVVLTQGDVRQFQLAKAAICAGIYTMLDICKVSACDVQVFYLAGGFGSYINKTDAARVGLIPRDLADKVVVLGNAAGNGAGMLLSDAVREEAVTLKQTMLVEELSESPVFMDQYINQMSFEL